MQYSFALSALALFSSALAITVTEPTSGTTWDFSTPKTIKFSASSSDPADVSIILIDPSTNFQIKIADNVKTASGSYTTQPNPSVPNGSGYEIQIIDSAGVLAKSGDFTVEAGASSSDNSAETTSAAASSTEASTAASSTASSSRSASSNSNSATTTTAAASSSATLATVTVSQTTATSSSTPTGAASAITLNKMTAGAGALLGLAFLFA